ncbi:S9 family peptidase [Agrilutibacter solisilvae]|uniref:S9 family peptidase n=1 Tax=Agrilutibacter solisilvae TaxID=2763317 RepID=A0A974XXY3_9GAMM|nr:prolyl oligopeptidase family serine peptidase [Lysobacter solisilvae]QSX77811.1 S9 family peptidase [Lysobacter solisilvae]
MLLVALATAPASAQLRQVAPGESPTLAADEGLLLVAVDSTVALSVARFARVDGRDASTLADTTDLGELPVGRSHALFVAPAGRYRWENTDTTTTTLRLADDTELRFDVAAGQLNYVGDLVLRPLREDGGLIAEASATLANRSLAAIDWLDQHHARLHARHRLQYAGHYPDPFPAFYAHERDSHPASVEPATTFDPPPQLATPLPLTMSRLAREPRFSQVRLNGAGDLLALQVREGEDRWRIDLVAMANGATTVVATSAVPFGQLLWADDRHLVLGAGEQAYRRAVQVLRLQRTHAGWQARRAQVPRAGEVLHARGDVLVFASLSGRGDVQVHRIAVPDQAAADALAFDDRDRLEPGIDGVLHWETDRHGALRLARVHRGDGESWLYGRDGRYAQVRRLGDAPGDVLDLEPVGLSGDGAYLYALTERGREQRDAVAIDLATGAVARTVFSRPGVDVESLVLDRAQEPLSVTYLRDGQRVSEYFGPRGALVGPVLARLFPGHAVTAAARSANGRRWAVWVEASDRPPALHVVDLDARSARLVPGNTPWLDGLPLRSAQLLRVPTRDGLVLDAFLTLPAGTQRVPLVVLPHGGPIGIADSRRFDAKVQFLVALGHAVLQVNFRGSAGYGRAFREAGLRGQGTSIEDDVNAAIAHALARDDAAAHRLDAGRMCMVGASYGGYSGLVAAVRWPDRFRCVVSIAGVSDRLLAFSASDSALTPRGRAQMEQVMGDPRTQAERIRAASPLYRYRELRTPVMLAHGVEDRRVDFEQSRRLGRMLALAGRPAVGLAFEGEGHGLVRPENVDRLWTGVAGFLERMLAPTAPGAARVATVAP